MLKNLRASAKSAEASKLARHRACYATGGSVGGSGAGAAAKAYATGGMVDGGTVPGRTGFPKLGSASRMKPGSKKAKSKAGGTNVNVIVMPKEAAPAPPAGPMPMPPMPPGAGGPPPMPPPMPPPGAGPGGPGPMPPMRAHGGSVKKREDGGEVTSESERRRADDRAGSATMSGASSALSGIMGVAGRRLPTRLLGAGLSVGNAAAAGHSLRQREEALENAEKLKREGRRHGGSVKKRESGGRIRDAMGTVASHIVPGGLAGAGARAARDALGGADADKTVPAAAPSALGGMGTALRRFRNQAVDGQEDRRHGGKVKGKKC